MGLAMESQVTEPVLEAVAVYEIGEPVLETAMVCDWGAAPPATWVKESDAGLTDMLEPVTLKVTGMVTGLSATAAPVGLVAVMVMLPE